MTRQNPTPPDTDQEPKWSDIPLGVLIMGKRQGIKRENKQLWGRVALAAALWHSAPYPKPYLMFVSSDIHGPQRRPDADVVKELLVDRFGISADYVILRQKANCTLIEVRAARILKRAYGLSEIISLTHLYHAARTQRYLDEVFKGEDASVIPVHPEILTEITYPETAPVPLETLQTHVRDSQPHWLDRLREYGVEWLLGLAHRLDSRGRLERVLAHLLRPGAYPKHKQG